MKRAVVLFLLSLTGGCGHSETDGAPEEPTPYDLGPPTLEISGVGDDEGRLEFFRIVSADFADDGSLVLADAGLLSIIVVPSVGDPYAIDLGRGEGPGEGQAISQVGSLTGDTVYWVDPLLHRVNFLRTSTGERLDPISVPFEPDRGLPEVIGKVDDSTLLILQWSAPVFSGSAEVTRGPARVYCGTVQGTRGAEIEVAGSEQLLIPEGAGYSSNRLPFAAGPILATWNGRILYSDSRSLDIEIFECGGTTVRQFSLPQGAQLGQDRTRQALNAWLAEAPPGLASRMGRIFDEYEPVVTGPGAAHGRILTDPTTGRLWVESTAGGRWIVTDSTGRPWAPVRLPEGRMPLTVKGDQVVLLAIDSLGVHRVEVRELRASSSG